MESRVVVGSGWGEGEAGKLLFNKYRGLISEDEKILEIDGGDGCTKMWMYLSTLNGPLKNVKNGNFYDIYSIKIKK